MKSFLLIVITGALLFILYFKYLAYRSQQAEPVGLINNQLTPCPSSPNCVCSEYSDNAQHSIPPVSISNMDASLLRQLIDKSIMQTGGKITHREKDYFAATYTSRFFGFVDDLEIRIDHTQQQLHIRSASREGHSDFGVNRQRTERLRQYFESNSQNSPDSPE